MKITIESYDKKMTCELPSDTSSAEVLEAFCGLMVTATFTPSTIYNALEAVADNYRIIANIKEDDVV